MIIYNYNQYLKIFNYYRKVINKKINELLTNIKKFTKITHNIMSKF